MRIFISGGCKNGKSYYAQHMAKTQRQADKNGGLYYVATMQTTGAEDDERIARHRQERAGWGFVTVEQPRDIEEILEKCDCAGSFLLDSVTALLANEMFPPDGEINMNAGDKISEGLIKTLEYINSIVIVSDFIYSDAMIYDPITEAYRKSLAAVDRICAKYCDAVLEIAYSNVIVHKGNADKLPAVKELSF